MVYNSMMEAEQQTTIDKINGLSEIADYMNDEELTAALAFIAKIILKPDIPMNVATIEVVRLQAIAAKMAFRATWMTNVDKGDRAKKNIYYTAAEAINDLVSALKYIIR
jgi:predicted S18 family serine protease